MNLSTALAAVLCASGPVGTLHAAVAQKDEIPELSVPSLRAEARRLDSSDDGGGGGLQYPSSQDLERIEAIYGEQLSEDEFSKWTKDEYTWLHIFGLNQLVDKDKVSAYSVHLLNPYHMSEIVTMSDAELICATECDRLPTCEAVLLHRSCICLDEIVCDFIDRSRGPALVTAGSNNLEFFTNREPSVLYKDGVDPFPDEYEGCDVPTSLDDLQAAVTCLLTGSSSPPCDDLLTADFLSYLLPAIQCVSDELGSDGLLPCLGCLQNALSTKQCYGRVFGTCASDSDINIITGECGSACVPSPGELTAECFADIQTAMLCAASVSVDKNGEGCIANQAGFDDLDEDYTCPDAP